MNNTEINEKLQQRPYNCYHCSRNLGTRTDTVLIIGAVRFTRSVTMICEYCKRMTFFKPDESYIKQGSSKLDKL